LEKVRWEDKPICPYCKSIRVTSFKKEQRHHCNNCNTSFSVTVGTVFHKTKLDLQKWFLAIGLLLNARKGISARHLARAIHVNKNTACYMQMRIRRAIAQKSELLSGIIEADETHA
jgi:transposase-like protein